MVEHKINKMSEETSFKILGDIYSFLVCLLDVFWHMIFPVEAHH